MRVSLWRSAYKSEKGAESGFNLAHTGQVTERAYTHSLHRSTRTHTHTNCTTEAQKRPSLRPLPLPSPSSTTTRAIRIRRRHRQRLGRKERANSEAHTNKHIHTHRKKHKQRNSKRINERINELSNEEKQMFVSLAKYSAPKHTYSALQRVDKHTKL